MYKKYAYASPDPERYRPRSELSLPPELAHDVGIFETGWEPFEEQDGDLAAYTDRLVRQPILSLRDIHDYRPLQIEFRLPNIAPNTDFTDEWYEKLFSALRHLVEEFCEKAFGTASTAPTRTSFDSGVDADSPWGFALPYAFVMYAGDIAVTDENDGGWDALLLDPVQRGSLVKGVLMKLLDEHVFSDLLFGGTAIQKKQMKHLDTSMLRKDGYARKLERCKEAQRVLGKEHTSANFWDEVDRITSETAQMLMPLINLQRHILIETLNNSEEKIAVSTPLSTAAFYQGLYDIIAVAGYASLRMARSTSIFQIDFPEVGQLWDIDQQRSEHDPVYESSLQKVRAIDTMATMAGLESENEHDHERDHDDGHDLDHDSNNDNDNDNDHDHHSTDSEEAAARVDRIKIVVWPRIQRFKPVWNHSHDQVNSATRIFISRSHNLYYCGEAGKSNTGFDEESDDAKEGPEHDHGFEERNDKEAGQYADSATSPVLDLFEYVEQARAARIKAQQIKVAVSFAKWLIGVYLLYFLLTYLRAWYGAGWDEVRRLVAEHALLVAGSVASALYVAMDTALAAPGYAIVAADHFVDTVVKPAIDRLPSRATILAAVRRQP